MRRTAALVVVFTLGIAGWVECADWQDNSETRMDCCLGDGSCPMHGSGAPGDGAERVVAQAEADSCCALSGADPAPLSVAVVLSASAAPMPRSVSTVLQPAAPRASFDAWHAHAPLPVGRVSKHVLLSVFLI